MKYLPINLSTFLLADEEGARNSDDGDKVLKIKLVSTTPSIHGF